MTFEEELEAIEERTPTREVVGACADVATRALAVNDLPAVVRARQWETQSARFLGMHNHAVVVTAETVDLWPRLKEEPEVEDGTRKRFVWTFKHGAGSAMDLPEIPLATVRDLFATMRAVLDHFGTSHVALWELEARLAYIEDEGAMLRDRVEKIMPVLGMRSYIESYSDCPGCTLMQFVRYLGPDADAEQVEAVLEPVLKKKPFPYDAPSQAVYSLLFGDDTMCAHAKALTPIELAKAYARAGRLAEARGQAEHALREVQPTDTDARLAALSSALEVAVATREVAKIDELVEKLRPLVDTVEDPYYELEAVLVLHRAIATRDHRAECSTLRDRALALARRVDMRLAKPRHLAETERLLAARTA